MHMRSEMVKFENIGSVQSPRLAVPRWKLRRYIAYFFAIHRAPWPILSWPFTDSPKIDVIFIIEVPFGSLFYSSSEW